MTPTSNSPVQLTQTTAADGWLWFVSGIKTFLKQPLALGGLFFITLAVFQVLSLIPLIGLLVWVVLTPSVNVGFMAAMADAERQTFPMPKRLITALIAAPARRRAMLILGGLYLAGIFLIAMLTWLLFGTDLAQFAKANEAAIQAMGTSSASSSAMVSPPPPTLDASTAQLGVTDNLPSFFWFLAAMGIPITLLTWHAPALVFWYGVTPVKALFFSAVACIRHFKAMLVYFGAWIAVTAPVMLLNQVLEKQSETQFIAMALLTPLTLAMAAAFTLSSYFTFKNSFVQHVPLP